MNSCLPPIVVTEHEDSAPVRLSIGERDALEGAAKAISVRSVPGSKDFYTLNPGNMVGAIQLGELRFELRPKLAIRRLLFLLSYSIDPRHWREEEFPFEEEPELFEAIAHGFASQLERALLGGPVQGYRFEEQSLQTIRGRIRFADQLRSRFSLIPPIECAFDEFTEDIEINRLLKAALLRLGEIRLRSPLSRRRLRLLHPYFANVSQVTYDRRGIPSIRFDSRTERYRGPVELARLILRSSSLDARSGETSGAAFLLDMAKVFEDFVVIALREELGVNAGALIQHAKNRPLHLDAERKLKLEPDLSLWRGHECVFVGDVKYKRTKPLGSVKHPDAYQMLAYVLAAERRRGLLVYAAGNELDGGEMASNGTHWLPACDKSISAWALDLGVPPEKVLEQIADLASEVSEQAEDPVHQLSPSYSSAVSD